MWFVSAVDLSVPVETAGVSQLLPTNLALDGWFPVGPNLTGSTFINVSIPPRAIVTVETT